MRGSLLELDEEDDPEFLELVRDAIVGALSVVVRSEAYVVKIDGWFGRKWLGFSNKELGAFGVHYADLRVPPFVPDRVLSQGFFRTDGRTYSRCETMTRLHVAQPSEANRRRLMKDICPGASAFWWSSGSKRNGRGSLMAYEPTPEGHIGWYAGFEKQKSWRIIQTLGTTLRDLNTLMRLASAPRADRS